jgi:hypothetical protein
MCSRRCSVNLICSLVLALIYPGTVGLLPLPSNPAACYALGLFQQNAWAYPSCSRPSFFSFEKCTAQFHQKDILLQGDYKLISHFLMILSFWLKSFFFTLTFISKSKLSDTVPILLLYILYCLFLNPTLADTDFVVIFVYAR